MRLANFSYVNCIADYSSFQDMLTFPTQVFELLTRLGLPGFGRANWQSTIRHEVSCCTKYNQLSAWRGVETSDIVYDDVEGILIGVLIERGYVPSEHGQRRLKFYIEVKATPSDANEPFYVSSGQYTRVSVYSRH